MRFENDVEQYEFLSRALALFLVITAFRSLEIALSVRDNLDGDITSNALSIVIPGVFALSLSCLLATKIERPTELSRASCVAASLETSGLLLTWMAVSSAAISIGNNKAFDALVESGAAITGLVAYLVSAVMKKCGVETHVPLWNVISQKIGIDRLPTSSALCLGGSGVLVVSSIFAYQRTDYGSFVGDILSATTSMGIAAKMFYDFLKEKNIRDFPIGQFMRYAFGSAGFSFLVNALMSKMNNRSNTQCLTETISGAALLVMTLLIFVVEKIKNCRSANVETTLNYQLA